jgi:hypothetical protein
MLQIIKTMNRFAPLLYSICWLLHVFAVVCHLQRASGSVSVTWKYRSILPYAIAFSILLVYQLEHMLYIKHVYHILTHFISCCYYLYVTLTHCTSCCYYIILTYCTSCCYYIILTYCKSCCYYIILTYCKSCCYYIILTYCTSCCYYVILTHCTSFCYYIFLTYCKSCYYIILTSCKSYCYYVIKVLASSSEVPTTFVPFKPYFYFLDIFP